jgi:hypothetical protein
MRVYLPATLTTVRAALAAGELGPAPLTAFAVTPTLREWYAEGDTEELEYAALTDAARASLRLLDADRAAARRRVVVAADVPDGWVRQRPELDRAVVEVAAAVPLAKVVSAHVDDGDAQDAVAAAADAVVAADLGDDDARFTVDEAEGHELMWYATQELGALVGDA